MPGVTGYLRANRYPIGESPEHCWQRRRRQLARERARCPNTKTRRGHEDTKSEEQEEK